MEGLNGPVQGIVAEYNPFHNGHMHQLQACAEGTGSVHTICVMSGAFVQRGEPACFHKLARAEMALAAGADVVLELPAAFAGASAEFFAGGAVSTLEATGVVDWLCFGSETGQLEPLQTAARVLADEPEGFRLLLRGHLDEGRPFAAAREAALSQWLGTTGSQAGKAVPSVVGSPNNILAVEYLKALRRLGGTMRPYTIVRRGRGYHDPELESRYASATAIRRGLTSLSGPPSPSGTPLSLNGATDVFPEEISQAIPDTTRQVMVREMIEGRGPVTPEAFASICLWRLRTASPDDLSRLPYLEPGLALRLKQAALQTGSFSDLVGAATSTRYPRVRIQRILTALLIGVTDETLKALGAAGYAQYIRVLGFRERARPLLAAMRKRARVPVLGRTSQWHKQQDPLVQTLLAIEKRASDTWALACSHSSARLGGCENRLSPIRHR